MAKAKQVISGNNQPIAPSKSVRDDLQKLIITRRYSEIDGVFELTRDQPDFYHSVKYSRTLGSPGKISKEWKLIVDAGASLGRIAQLLIDMYPDYTKPYEGRTNQDGSEFSPDDIVYHFTIDSLALLQRDWKSLLIAHLPVTKTLQEREFESYEERELMRPTPEKQDKPKYSDIGSKSHE